MVPSSVNFVENLVIQKFPALWDQYFHFHVQNNLSFALCWGSTIKFHAQNSFNINFIISVIIIILVVPSASWSSKIFLTEASSQKISPVLARSSACHIVLYLVNLTILTKRYKSTEESCVSKLKTYCKKVKVSRYTPWRRLGGEEV
jgi:hypothetical protein